MAFNTALYGALKNTEFLLNVSDNSKYHDQILDSFKYQMSHREVLIYEKLGEYLSKGTSKLNVLDIGSGQLYTAEKLIKNTSFVANYTAIDNKVNANDFAKNMRPYVETFEYISLDILKEAFTSDKLFDIVLIDIEPHANEIAIYEKIKHVLSEVHLCILKHIGYMNIYVSSLADKFLTKYEDTMSDYYGESGCPDILYGIRDVFVIFDQTKTSYIRELLVGSTSRYFETDIKPFCRNVNV